MTRPVSPPDREIHLFGAFRIRDARGSRAVTGEKALSMLAYLVVHPHRKAQRELLADRLYPEAPIERVRRNFSDTLYRLKKTIGDEWLVVDRETIALRDAESLWVDVWEFDRLVDSPDPADLQKAIDLYAGDLVPECYEDWILPERELRRNRFLFALDTLAGILQARGDLQAALLNIRRLILIEPLNETAHQAYLRLLGRSQRFGEALDHYEYLRQLLRSELDADPLAETREIIRALEGERALASAPSVVAERMPFVGRESERAAALDAVEAALHGRGGMLAVEGAAGIGKSRLLRETAAGARWRGATVLQGTAGPTPGATPFAPMVDALAPFLNGPRAAHLESLLAVETLAILAPFHPAWGNRAGGPAPQVEPVGRYFFDALRTFGETLARIDPLVMILDDLHWASPSLWQCLRALASGLTGNGGLMLLAYRRPEIEDSLGWEILQEWDRAGRIDILALQPLTLEEVTRLLGDEPPADPAEVYAFTGGNPFFLSEWLAEGSSSSIPPEFNLAHRFPTLSPPARAALEAASVLGETVPYRLWADLAGLPPLELAAVGDELTARRWMEPAPAGYIFTHALLRAAVYDAIDPAQRLELHERAARAYARREPDHARGRAFHLDRAGFETEAAAAYRQAGEQNLKRFAFREAQTDLERALALMPDVHTIERIETALDLALVCEYTGDRARQRPALDGALAGSQELNDAALLIRANLASGRAASKTFQFAEAEAYISAALDLARSTQDDESEARAILLLGAAATQARKGREAKRHYTRALKLARRRSDQASEGRALSGLGIAARDMGEPDRAIKWLEQALEIHRRLGDRRTEIITLTYMITALYDLRAWDRLITIATEILPVTLAMGDRHATAYIQHLEGLASFNLGEYAEARQLFLKAKGGFEAVENMYSALMASNTLGLVAEGEGNHEEALQIYRDLLVDAEATGAENEATFVRQDLGILLLKRGRSWEAIPFLEQAHEAWVDKADMLGRLRSEAYLGWAWLSLKEEARAEALVETGWAAFQEGIPFGEKPQDWLWALYRLLAEFDRQDEAGAVLEAAYGELQSQARAVGDIELRRSFFERVALNREIVAAHDRMTGVIRTRSGPLAHREAPLGRALREDEMVPVVWTVNAPEDEAIAGKTDRRRCALKRLLREAEAQGAAPTDDDLAEALEVSRRTILRDLKALSAELPRPSTRKRKHAPKTPPQF